ncbi:MAG: N-formylglutamate amidohydrolase [Gammaproteobacteria bacterium]|nr:N-formylglutamate amidohydrolase [Gammaproteobacteria bacterium]NNF49770.1 N-formylglutamate amidohydrolase [Woeseiaceae bacterium]MBT8094132.1 N-formylglutamate amidohydrolase [Gammaproteobacteria bacterium]MBT8105865.1 N-formylglutamate amidohydrolase [Gammaproteobacteria bacterium]NNK25879.1 N-formylglutamate amidohydrolase [Woeseiaceae bacterium]
MARESHPGIVHSLLSPDEPGPYRVINPLADKPILLVCDHASCRFPASLGDMGLDPFARRCHLAIDIGAGPLTESLAKSLGVTAVVQTYSRLVVDCNRQLMDPSAFLEYGDGILVPGNRNLHQADKDLRASAIYWPYHVAISDQVSRLTEAGPPPALISIHSFTPVLNGESRDWQMGVLWDKDDKTRRVFLAGLRGAGYKVGDNEPYSGKAPQDFTIDHHAEEIGLPHVGIEIRQDLIDDDEGVSKVAEVMHDVIAAVPDKLGMEYRRNTA